MDQSKGVAGNTRIAAILAAIIPVVAGIYQQGEESRQRQAQRREEQRHALEKKAAADTEADIATAEALRTQLADGKEKFCAHLFFAAAQLPWQTVTTRTRDVVYAALQLRQFDDGRLTVCQCSGKSLQALWQFIPPYNGEATNRLSQGLRSAIDECDASSPQDPERLRVQQENEALRATQAALDATLRTNSNATQVIPELQQQATQTAPACLVRDPGETRRLRVFIQAPDAAAKEAAEVLRGALNERPPFKSPGIEVVGAGRSPQKLEVRYTYPMDKQPAQIVLEALESCTGTTADLVYLKRFQGRTDTGVIEVWWPAK